MTTVYLKTNWYFICILQLAGLATVSNIETILCDKKNGRFAHYASARIRQVHIAVCDAFLPSCEKQKLKSRILVLL